MTLRHLITLPAALLAILLTCGCRSMRMTAPPPDFQAPRIVVENILPPIEKPPEIKTITQDPLLSGVALTPKAKPRNWKWIIIHHSDTPMGSAARFDKAHRARGWECLGYDFVIGNGTETRDGLIEVGPRWTQQARGAHTGTPDQRFNDYGIGICLVGHFDVSRPTQVQMDSLARLCAYLMKTYNISANNIIGHRDCKPTACPGKYMDLPQLRTLAAHYARQ